MLKISIPVPCHEDWNKMTPDETGRHCSSCAKSVIDFTGMSDEEVQNYFLNKKEENTCGRFKQSQLHRIVIELPENILSINMPLWKKFLAACLIVFSTTLFSCDTNMKDKIVSTTETKDINTNQDKDRGYVGGLMFTRDSVLPPIECTVSAGQAIIFDTTISDITGLSIPLISENAGFLKTDTVPAAKPEDIIMIGDTIYEELSIKKLKVITPDTIAKTKNPPKVDSINCNTIKNYY